MREILFRGKRVDNGEWAYGYLTEIEAAWDRYEYGSLPVEFEFAIVRTDLCIREVVVIDQKTIGQYTGLTDNHGKKIFEGDIVLKRTYQGKKPMKVYFASGQFTCGVGGGSSTPSHYYTLDDNQIEIIGNIFDNPELIKE